MFYRFFQWRSLLLLIATSIIGGTIYYTRYVASKIEKEERQRVEEWVQANKVIQQSQEPVSISLAILISGNNEDIPLIATDENDDIVDTRNLDSNKLKKDPLYFQKQLDHLKSQNSPILWEISSTSNVVYKVYYGNSRLLNEVRYYPLVQLLIVALFIVLILSLVNIQNKSNENQVWAGMAKETAHQMGTPLTSLEGWVEMLKENPANSNYIPDLEKDVSRLKLVSDRFGKIGSTPNLEQTALVPLIEEMITYMKRRASGKVVFEFNKNTTDVTLLVSPTLFNWVLENLIKNALDAMEGAGTISITVEEQTKSVTIDITDTGKGIVAANIKKVFKPGFTTKKRGWGLGLSLSKRIMEQYHKGELFVKHSEPGKGTTFKIVIPK